MDVKSINTTGWRKPQGKANSSQAEKDDEESIFLGDQTLMPYSDAQRDISTCPTTMDWLLTWRKIVDSNSIR